MQDDDRDWLLSALMLATGLLALTLRCLILARVARLSPPTLAEHHNLDRLENDLKVQRERLIFYIIKVKTELSLRILLTGAVRKMDLSPASKSWLHEVPVTIKRNRL